MPKGFLPILKHGGVFVCTCVLFKNKHMSPRVKAGDDMHVNYVALQKSSAAPVPPCVMERYTKESCRV